MFIHLTNFVLRTNYRTNAVVDKENMAENEMKPLP
jgi:hypothetical protein